MLTHQQRSFQISGVIKTELSDFHKITVTKQSRKLFPIGTLKTSPVINLDLYIHRMIMETT